jgi:hypothetical protein
MANCQVLFGFNTDQSAVPIIGSGWLSGIKAGIRTARSVTILYHNGGGDVKKLEFKGYKISETRMLIKQSANLPITILVEVESEAWNAWPAYVLACLNKGNEFFVGQVATDYNDYANITDLMKVSGG